MDQTLSLVKKGDPVTADAFNRIIQQMRNAPALGNSFVSSAGTAVRRRGGGGSGEDATASITGAMAIIADYIPARANDQIGNNGINGTREAGGPGPSDWDKTDIHWKPGYVEADDTTNPPTEPAVLVTFGENPNLTESDPDFGVPVLVPYCEPPDGGGDPIPAVRSVINLTKQAINPYQGKGLLAGGYEIAVNGKKAFVVLTVFDAEGVTDFSEGNMSLGRNEGDTEPMRWIPDIDKCPPPGSF